MFPGAPVYLGATAFGLVCMVARYTAAPPTPALLEAPDVRDTPPQGLVLSLAQKPEAAAL